MARLTCDDNRNGTPEPVTEENLPRLRELAIAEAESEQAMPPVPDSAAG